ncbi:hypothetical protein PTTG_25836 [Puccinia triticina 1-1 BBBD Race 1]|uniref:Uncharacterized protein n=1 Tax=Puccinia triticina (isolate 1-1 / race 1 (BBBD)) TaxID=630390 RepID=A0A180GYB0_PUCT1|nr:hypothetical protein PTTG_25836 [Puccinia triticina 1-1 BBBD Race 1]
MRIGDTARPTLDGTTLASSAYSRSESNFSDLTEVPWDVGLRRALHRLAMMRSNSYPPLPAPIPMAEERPSPGASSVWYSTNDGGPVFATFDEDGHPIRPETPTERPFIRPSLPSPWGSRPASRESSTERRGATTYCPFEMEEDWLEGGTGFTVPTPPRQIPENLYPVRRPRQEI